MLLSLLLLCIVIFFRIKRRDKIIIISAFGWLGLDCGSLEIFLASRRVKYSVVDKRNIPDAVGRHRGPDEQDEVFDSRAQPLPLLSVLPEPLQQRCGSLISDYPEVFKCINHFFDFLRRDSLFRPERWIVQTCTRGFIIIIILTIIIIIILIIFTRDSCT